MCEDVRHSAKWRDDRIAKLERERDELEKALTAAVNSLDCLARAGSRDNEYLSDMIDVQGYAHSRASEAHRLLEKK